MPRRRKRETDEPVFAGRPPKDPMEKVGRPVRALVTQPVWEALKQASAKHLVLNLSDTFRLALFNFLKANDLMTPELYEDPTWFSLREKGLV